jgi:tetratricopeptide (TPR) repeat protein
VSTTPDRVARVAVVDPTVETGPGGQPLRRVRDQTLGHGAMVGRYMVLRMLGRGGVGTVYAAHDPKLDRQVALKLLHSSRGDGPERLVREAQALARLTDPHVVAVYDAGEIDGQVFIAMQLVDGADLASAVQRRKPSTAQVLDWFVQAGRGLAAAHAAGLVHRDFKPSNVLIDRKGHVAVTDFGLVRSVAAVDRGLTGMGDILGTPAFMSPEQHDLQPATQASDQFSFCVALWETLFDQHPFVAGDRGSMSPFEIGYRIFDGTLIPPPRGARVPRRVIDALTRGLSRDPAKRWPGMTELVGELVAEPGGRAWGSIAAGMAAAAIGGVAVWIAVGREDDAATCRVSAERRTATAWSPAVGGQIRARFAASTKSFAEAAAAQTTHRLDRYAARWRQIAADACLAERAAEGAVTELVVRRRTCLDTRLDALRGVADLLATTDSATFVEHAHEIADGLPDLADCADAGALAAGPTAPPADKAAEVAELEHRLALAAARGLGGDPGARDELAALATRADRVAWPPLQIRAHLEYGLRRIGTLEPGEEPLVRAAELATAHRLDRDAARAWAGAVIGAALARKADVVAVLAPTARAAAQRTGDRRLEVDAEIAHGRALTRLGSYQEASELCKAAFAAAQTLDQPASITAARDCLLESLAPLGAIAEITPMLEQMIADVTRTSGADHPRIADYLSVRSQLWLRQGKLAEARADADRSAEIRGKAYPPEHVKNAEALELRAQLAMTSGQVAEAKQLYTEALARGAAIDPPPLRLLGAVHTMLGFLAVQVDNDLPRALRHFEEAAPLIEKRAGAESLELGILLSNYGQYKAMQDVDAGLAILGEARAILDKLRDKRALSVATAMAEIEVNARRWSSARIHAEEMVAHADADADPFTLAMAKWMLAQALVRTGGDRKRAHQLASEARAVYAQAGPTQAKELAKIDGWLARN